MQDATAVMRKAPGQGPIARKPACTGRDTTQHSASHDNQIRDAWRAASVPRPPAPMIRRGASTRPECYPRIVIRLDEGTRRFNYRVVGVAIHNDTVLLHRAVHEDFWTLPGGRAEHGETAEQTIRREMYEELGTSIEVVRLLWLVENFFDHDGLSYHELALYFLIRLPPGSAPLSVDAFDAVDAAVPLKFRWYPVEPTQLASLPLFPTFLSHALANLPPSVVHIVERDAVPSTEESSISPPGRQTG